MGLISFLKNKFSKKKIEEVENHESETKQDQQQTNIELPKEENKNIEEQTINNNEQHSLQNDNLGITKTENNTKVENKEIDTKTSYIYKPQEQIKEIKRSKEEEQTKAYVQGLKKSNKGFMAKLKKLTSIFNKVNDEYFDELEEILIEADVGVDLTINLIDKTKKQSKELKITDPKAINELLIDEMFKDYQKNGNQVAADIHFKKDLPTVLLVVGVNGVGKTTTIAKLAYRYKNQGKKVLLVAGDTFRAGAVEQLKVWAERLGVDIITGKENSDPSSLVYDGLSKAKKEHFDLVIVDTAGRLQNKANLMAELGKMKRVMSKILPSAPDETFLIIDANTGQNGVEQAKVFKEVTPLTGIIITKMDGTSKGGIILAIRNQLGIPVRFIGLGEGFEDLREFDLDSYLYGLLIGDDENV